MSAIKNLIFDISEQKGIEPEEVTNEDIKEYVKNNLDNSNPDIKDVINYRIESPKVCKCKCCGCKKDKK